ncbi:MAG TPA: hypothetical protein PL105_03420, partial [Caldilineaceae bacterium]|nr:hypothetical protein [Caldilineaceae bacterium]
ATALSPEEVRLQTAPTFYPFDQYRKKAGFFSILSAKISPFRAIRVLFLLSPTGCWNGKG